MSRLKFVAWLVLVLFGAAFSAYAHPGHGVFDQGATHAFTSVYHLLMLVASGVLVFTAAQFLQRKWARHSCRIAGAAMVLIALASASS